jgi:hypothetical protein
MLRAEYRRLPVTYFCPESGIGRGMKALEGHPRRIGILGLGCGTLAAYGLPGDTPHEIMEFWVAARRSREPRRGRC